MDLNQTSNVSTDFIHKLVTPESLDDLHIVYYILNGIIGSTICCFGIIANTLNISIFASMLKTQKSATITFLLVIAAADLLAMVIYLLYGIVCLLAVPRPIINKMDLTRDQAGTFPYIVYYLWYFPANVFITTSNWCTVSVMLFRFIAIYLPLKASQWCSIYRAKVVLVVIMLFSVLAIVPDCFTLRLVIIPGYGPLFFNTNLQFNRLFYYIYYITFLEMVNSILPFVICLVLTGLLIRTLSRSSKQFHVDSASTSKSTRQRDQRRISVMLLVVVLTFIICTIPSFIWRGMKRAADLKVIASDHWTMLRGIADVFLIINHSINFLIYLLTNERHRKLFYSLILRRKLSRRDNSMRSNPNRSLTAHGSSITSRKMKLVRVGSTAEDPSTSMTMCRAWYSNESAIGNTGDSEPLEALV